MNKIYKIILCVIMGYSIPLFSQTTQRVYLSGTDKDHTVDWLFRCTKGRRAGITGKIAVPSCWETKGFGSYHYGRGEVEPEGENGFYSYRFPIKKEWKGQNVRLVFEGSMTDTHVKMNGISAGEVHQGSFYRFSYDVTNLLKYGAKNILEVEVDKRSSNASVNNAERAADFWIFGGIYRPVYLEISPNEHISSIALNADMQGHLRIRTFTEGLNALPNYRVLLSVKDRIGNEVPVKGNSDAAIGNDIDVNVENPHLWNQEKPYLYTAEISLLKNGKTIHTKTEKFGFRTMEFREHDGFYLNGARVIFKGANRHCFWPESGRTLSHAINLNDALLMKSMNMNAVRCSHYPPDVDFLNVCDSLGLLVLDELCGWQSAYDTQVARKLVKEMVERDRNHPSVVIWDNGNEGGWNRAVDDDFSLYDLQHRFVIHPWEKFRGTDTKHYPIFNYTVNSTLYGQEVRFPTEFMHGLYDGGCAAGLQDFWNTMMKHRHPAGGFIWALVDEGVVRDDLGGKVDACGDQAPDGILGPHREKEGSFDAIRKIWSPVIINNLTIPEVFDGRLSIENNYMFTDLKDCKIAYSLDNVSCNASKMSVTHGAWKEVPSISLSPGERRYLSLPKEDWKSYEILNVRIYNPEGMEIYTWQWPLGNAGRIFSLFKNNSVSIKNEKAVVTESGDRLLVKFGNADYEFNKQNGLLAGVSTSLHHYPLTDGPVVLNHENKFKSLQCSWQADTLVVEPLYEDSQWIKWLFIPGNPVCLSYSYNLKEDVDYMGIGFNYPEKQVRSMEWLGNGPFRVWKNRLQGVEFGLWKKSYNNTITGESWDYPEFKGYHSDCRIVSVADDGGRMTFAFDEAGKFFQMLKAPHPAGTKNGNTTPAFPQTNIGFLEGISPIGAKFQPASQMGPSSQKNMQLNKAPVEGRVWMDFE